MRERCAETLPLVLVEDSESDLGRSGLHDDVAGAARDHRPAAFVHDCNQCDVVDEIDVHKKIDLRFRESAPYGKETAVKGLAAGAGDGRDEFSAIIRSESADFDSASIA